VEDALRVAEGHGAGEERAAGGDQPARALVGAAELREHDQGKAADERDTE
jgi:hypothetical protein